MKRWIAVLLLLCLSVPVLADPCQDCAAKRKALNREAQAYRAKHPCPKCKDCPECPQVKKRSIVPYVIGAIVVGGAGYLIGRASGDDDATIYVTTPCPSCPTPTPKECPKPKDPKHH
jgi:hypothetical protein